MFTCWRVNSCFRNGGVSEVLPDELLHIVKLGLKRLAIGLDDGRRQDKQAHEKAVALLVS